MEPLIIPMQNPREWTWYSEQMSNVAGAVSELAGTSDTLKRRGLWEPSPMEVGVPDR